MFISRLFLAFVLIISVSTPIFAQNSEEAKEKQRREIALLDRILSDAENLRLPENRAFVLARVGGAFWKTDEKLARKLFQEAINDLVTGQTEAENEKGNKQYFQPLIYGQSPRMEIINFIAARDAELALEVLAKTRPPKIAQALGNSSGDSQSALQQYAKNEIQAEQRLIGLAAEQNPQIAIKRVRESLKRDFTYETLNLLKKIYTKDPDAANQLAEEVMQKFLSADLSKNYQDAEILGYFVAELGKEKTAEEKSVKIPDNLLRGVASKMIDFWLNAKTNQINGYWSAHPVIEKLFPDRMAKVKEKIDFLNNRYQTAESQEYNKLMQSDAAPDELLAQAEKLPVSYRNEIYRKAAEKYVQNGNLGEAQRIMTTNISEEAAEQYLSQFYANLANQTMYQGKFDEAQGYANQIPDENQRLNALISLANVIYQKDPKENQKLAESVLDQARSLVSDAPETQNEFNSLMYLATAYVPLQPKEAFRLIEPLIPPLNELIQANAVLMKFRNYGGFRRGEIQITSGNSLGVYNLENLLRTLKNHDFDRTLQITGGINRLETRVWLELQLIDENLITQGMIVNLPVMTRFSKRQY
jgi:hypothetical protein